MWSGGGGNTEAGLAEALTLYDIVDRGKGCAGGAAICQAESRIQSKDRKIRVDLKELVQAIA